MCLLFFQIYQKVFSMQGAWHSSNMLPTMVSSQALCIITWQPQLREFPLSAIRGCTEHSCGSWKPSPVPGMHWALLWVLETFTSTGDILSTPVSPGNLHQYRRYTEHSYESWKPSPVPKIYWALLWVLETFTSTGDTLSTPVSPGNLHQYRGYTEHSCESWKPSPVPEIHWALLWVLETFTSTGDILSTPVGPGNIHQYPEYVNKWRLLLSKIISFIKLTETWEIGIFWRIKVYN